MHKQIKEIIRRISAWSNYDPPGALSSKGWRLFNQEFKEKAPIRYWFKHDFSKAVIYPIKWKYNEIHMWIRYRTSDKCHIIDTGLPPGYYEVDTLMLNTNFTILKNFVEIGLAKRTYWFNAHKGKDFLCRKYIPFYNVFFPFRRPDLGMEHLNWAETLDDPNLPMYQQDIAQAISAREIKLLYKWWIEDRPSRKELEYISYNKQGLGALCSLDDDFDTEAEDYKIFKKRMDDKDCQESDWLKEDDEMLLRLVKIRHSLWS